MTSITEDGGDWRPNRGESMWGCANPWIDELHIRVQAYDHCGQCSEVPYRVVVIGSERSERRGVALCGRHFLEACKECHDKNGGSLPRGCDRQGHATLRGK